MAAVPTRVPVAGAEAATLPALRNVLLHLRIGVPGINDPYRRRSGYERHNSMGNQVPDGA